VCIASLDPALGSEAAKSRPVVIVSNDSANIAAARSGRGVITVVPLTSNVERILPFQVLLPTSATGLKAPSKAQAEQVRAISIQRIGRSVGSLPAPFMIRVDEALRIHLAL